MLELFSRHCRRVVPFAILFAGALVAAEPEPHHFAVVIESKIAVTSGDQVQNLVAKTDLKYSWTRAGQDKILQFVELGVDVHNGDQLLLDSFMSRVKWKHVTATESKEATFAQAAPGVQQMLRDTFDTPLCRITTDANGAEVKRTVVANAGAKTSVDNGMIANALLFHPPYYADRDEWEVEREMSMGNGGYAKGKITYRKSDEPHLYTLRGSLTNAAFQPPRNPITIKNATYDLAGKQLFDADRRSWSTGEMHFDLKFDMFAGDVRQGASQGTLDLKFERLGK